MLAIAVVVLGSDRASGQADIHVLMPAVDVVRGSGFDLGDSHAARGALVDAESGESAGDGVLRVHGNAQDPQRGPGVLRCSHHLKLADGGIILQGLDPRGVGASTFAVLGGTETYRGASGDAVFTDSDDETDIAIALA